MDIFCDVIDDQLHLQINENSTQIDIPKSFYEQLDSIERTKFISEVDEFLEINQSIKFLIRNKAYVRTNRISKFDLGTILYFCEDTLGVVSTKIFSSELISRNDLLTKNFPIEKEEIQLHRKKHIAQNTISQRDKLKRKKIQLISILIIAAISSFLIFYKKIPPGIDIHPEIFFPKTYWILGLGILIFNILIQYSLMKITPYVILLNLGGVFLAIMLIPRILTTEIISLLDLSNSIMWTEFIFQAILYYLWNEKASVHIPTKNGQFN
jgi:hypothetical protein